MAPSEPGNIIPSKDRELLDRRESCERGFHRFRTPPEQISSFRTRNGTQALSRAKLCHFPEICTGSLSCDCAIYGIHHAARYVGEGRLNADVDAERSKCSLEPLLPGRKGNLRQQPEGVTNAGITTGIDHAGFGGSRCSRRNRLDVSPVGN
jgi:hypothetical protein